MKALLAFFAGIILGLIARTATRTPKGLLFIMASVLAVTGILTNRAELSLLSIPLMLIARRGG